MHKYNNFCDKLCSKLSLNIQQGRYKTWLLLDLQKFGHFINILGGTQFFTSEEIVCYSASSITCKLLYTRAKLVMTFTSNSSNNIIWDGRK